jgi:Flp pilus assembly protein TadG
MTTTPYQHPSNRRPALQHRRSNRRGYRSDVGDVAVEAAIVVPAVLALLMAGLTVAGRSVQAQNQAGSAAQEAARAASMEQSPSAATAAALAAVDANTTDAVGLTCDSAVELNGLSPGSVIVVEVTCDAALIGGHRATFEAQAVEVVDRFRQGDES